jgi:hypothetical protein
MTPIVDERNVLAEKRNLQIFKYLSIVWMSAACLASDAFLGDDAPGASTTGAAPLRHAVSATALAAAATVLTWNC